MHKVYLFFFWNSARNIPSKLTDRCTDQKSAVGFFHGTDQYFLPYRRKTDRMAFSEAGFSSVSFPLVDFPPFKQ